MVENARGEVRIRALKPKATAAVCAKFPMAIPSAVGMPARLPLMVLRLSINRLSGPGSRARPIEANKNGVKTLISGNIIIACWYNLLRILRDYRQEV
jgi:hypothetical protein